METALSLTTGEFGLLSARDASQIAGQLGGFDRYLLTGNLQEVWRAARCFTAASR
jgi:hypothetical protein